jgi:SH3-like domain-containing protein
LIKRTSLAPDPTTLARTLAALLLLVFPCAAQAAERQTPSGFEVPRYVTLKFAKVNARSGPGDDHKLLFVYRMRGLPLQVIAETSEWRRVCDPEGQVAWVHRRVTEGRRAVINTTKRPAPILHSPKPGSETVALLNVRAMAELDQCKKGWCRIKVGGAKGWVREGSLWGTAPLPQCR